MTEGAAGAADQGEERYGQSLDAALAQRERLADKYDIDFGRERVFPQLVDALLAEVPEGARLLEVGAATGLLTRPLLERAGHVTAMEPSTGMLRHLLASDVADSAHLTIRQGMVEDLVHDDIYDVAVVTFTPRRGRGLSRLLTELAIRVRERVVMLLDDDGSMDWAYLARSAAMQGIDVRLHIVTSHDERPEHRKRAVVLVADLLCWEPTLEPVSEWGADATRIAAPYPPPRGTATRLVRYLLAGGDRAMRIVTDPRGVERLYGNLRTAAHRLAHEEITVRRHGDEIHIVRLPKGSDTRAGE